MTDRRALILLTLVPVALWLACRPFVDMPVNDDFSYAFTAKRLLETGRLTYNGWSAPIVGAQAYWGAGFAAVFGFSHDVLRVSTLVAACGCPMLAYRLYRSVGVPVWWSAFATLLLVTSPLFTPWAASFMTDVPGLCLTLAIANAALALARATRPRDVWAASIAVATLGLIGGSIRQTNLACAGIALVLEALCRRGRLRLAPTTAAGALAVLGGAMVAWAARQPYSVRQWAFEPNAVRIGVEAMARFAPTCVLALLPLGIACLRPAERRWRVTAGVVFAVVFLVSVLGPFEPDGPGWASRVAFGPWAKNTVTATGLLSPGSDVAGDRPIVFGRAARAAMAAGVLGLAVVAIAAGLARSRSLAATLRRLPRALGDGGPPRALFAFALFGLVYAGLLLVQAAQDSLFDRYALVLIPIASTIVLRATRDRLSRTAGPGPLAWAVLAIYAAVGIAITHDHFAELRERSRIAGMLAARGIPRTAVSNGLAFDAWTQLEAAGHLNFERINPPEAYHRDPYHAEREGIFESLPRTPAVQPRWIVLSTAEEPEPHAGQATFAFDAWLPPRQRWLAVWPLPEIVRQGVATREAATRP